MYDHIDLFSGIGGFALAARWNGVGTRLFVELDPFCQRVLKARFGAVADTKCSEQNRGNEWWASGIMRGKREPKEVQQNVEYPLLIPDIRDVDGTRFRGSWLLTGGFPCQPFSCAGKRKGTADNRFLWPEMCRVIRESQPEWVLAENVSGLLSQDGGMVFERVLADLEDAGYETLPLVIPACGVGAPHRRDRVWIVAHSRQQRERNKESRFSNREQSSQEKRERSTKRDGFTDQDCHVADARCLRQKISQEQAAGLEQCWSESWLEVATRLCGIPHGLSNWLDNNWRRINGKTGKTVSRQDMSYMWDYFQSESVQWNIRRQFPLLTKENLLTVLCKFKTESETSDGLFIESKGLQEEYLRTMWENRELGHSPQRWEHQEQSTKQPDNALPLLPHEIALAAESIIRRYKLETNTTSRVHRLKALGNSIVPQVAYEIIRAMKEAHG